MFTDLGDEPSGLPDRLSHLFAYWAGIKGDRAMPRRSDFDPIHIPKLLPHIVLTEVIREQPDERVVDFEIRVIGEHVDDRMLDRYAGRRLSEIDGKGPDSDIWNVYSAVTADKRPKTVSLNYIGTMHNTKATIEVYLPLSKNGRLVDFVLVGIVFV